MTYVASRTAYFQVNLERKEKMSAHEKISRNSVHTCGNETAGADRGTFRLFEMSLGFRVTVHVHMHMLSRAC